MDKSLNGIWEYNLKHDCGVIGAFKFNKKDSNKLKEFKENTREYKRFEMNLKQNDRKLTATLMYLGYYVIRMYAKELLDGISKIEGFGIVDFNDKGKLKADLISLGIEYEQDSILFAPKGSVSDNLAYIYGLSNSKNSFIKKDDILEFNIEENNAKGEVFSYYINGKPFVFDEMAGFKIEKPTTGFGLWAFNNAINRSWLKRRDELNKGVEANE